MNAGLSVSGLQHVGRLRGEITLSQILTRSLRAEGRNVLQSLVLYTQDEWKAKEKQIAQFPGDEGSQYIGRRLIDVPDPFGCHGTWVDHYWVDFGGVLDRFAPSPDLRKRARGESDVRIVTTTQAYENPEMQAIVRDLAARAEEVRLLVNKYRSRRPYPQGWIPFEAFCDACGKIGAKTVGIDGTLARYKCEKCGHEGTSSVTKGKLNWRLEWASLWKVYRVDIEPFGKDHATPGGSRDSCKEIIETLLKTRAPMGIPYEWVGIADRGKDLGDMGSSDFLGFSPAQWLEVGDPEVIRYAYTFNPIFRRVVFDLSRADGLHDTYDMAEAAYYSDEREGDEEAQARSFELAQLGPVPEEKPFALSYRHAAFLAQIGPSGNSSCRSRKCGPSRPISTRWAASRRTSSEGGSNDGFARRAPGSRSTRRRTKSLSSRPCRPPSVPSSRRRTATPSARTRTGPRGSPGPRTRSRSLWCPSRRRASSPSTRRGSSGTCTSSSSARSAVRALRRSSPSSRRNGSSRASARRPCEENSKYDLPVDSRP